MISEGAPLCKVNSFKHTFKFWLGKEEGYNNKQPIKTMEQPSKHMSMRSSGYVYIATYSTYMDDQTYWLNLLQVYTIIHKCILQ